LKNVLITPLAMMLPAAETDLSTLSALWNEPGVRHQLFDGEAVTPLRARRLLEAGLSGAEAGLGWWLVHPWGSAEALGCVGLLPSRVSEQAFSTPGEAVAVMAAFQPEAWTEGHASEAVREVVRHAVHGLCLPRLSVLGSVPGPIFDRLLRLLGFEPRLEADAGHHRLRLYELDGTAARLAGPGATHPGRAALRPAPALQRAVVGDAFEA
jgi:RimJ/RimL family protein N-acetyltransferase